MTVKSNPHVGGKKAEAFIEGTPDARIAPQQPVKEKVAVAFTPEELAELDALRRTLGNLPRTSCIRLALKRLAQVELG